MNAQKQFTAKRWAADQTAARLAAEAEAREKTLFAKIACIGLQMTGGSMTRMQARDRLLELGVTREILQKFEAWRRPSAAI